MSAAILEIPDLTTGIPRTLANYHERVRQDNEWFYSLDATIFRVTYQAKVFFPDKDFEDLLGTVGCLLSAEKSAIKRGVPDALTNTTA